MIIHRKVTTKLTNRSGGGVERGGEGWGGVGGGGVKGEDVKILGV